MSGSDSANVGKLSGAHLVGVDPLYGWEGCVASSGVLIPGVW